MRRSVIVAAVLVLAGVALATAVVYPLKQVADPLSLGVVYLLPVLVVSMTRGLAPGLATTLLGAVAFNLFHIPPTGELTIGKNRDVVAFVTFVVVSAAVAAVADLARRRTVEADQGREEADRAARLAEELLAAAKERERLQAEVVETEALRQADVVKTALLRTVSHDLRSPLTALVTSGHALGSASLSHDEREELAQGVVIEAERLASMVDKLLDLSRLQAGAAPPHPGPVAVDEVLMAVAEHAGPRVRVTADPDLPLIQADAAQLERAFANLVENALRVSDGKPVSVRARQVGSRLMVRVVDRGPGIPRGQEGRLFEAFERGDATDGHSGSGLGLAIVRGFVEANGGTIAVESLPGQGTSFVIAFAL